MTPNRNHAITRLGPNLFRLDWERYSERQWLCETKTVPFAQARTWATRKSILFPFWKENAERKAVRS